jgi:hypothetical protein
MPVEKTQGIHDLGFSGLREGRWQRSSERFSAHPKIHEWCALMIAKGQGIEWAKPHRDARTLTAEMVKNWRNDSRPSDSGWQAVARISRNQMDDF